MIASFKDKGSEDIFNGVNSREARQACPQHLWKIAGKRLDQLDSAVALDDLRVPPGNRLEALAGPRRHQHSIRINDQFRICFVWKDRAAHDVEIVDYH